ncbi:MAG: bifunctional aspartate kinase/diaminopimelate decarboxylase, partial [Myxococcota bacterium]
MKPWVVLKFGGTSVSSASRWETIAKILRDRVSEGLRPVVVCSALSQVSNQLEAAFERAMTGESPLAFVDDLRRRHQRFAAELEIEVGGDIDDECARLAERLTGVSLLREASPRVRAEVLAA